MKKDESLKEMHDRLKLLVIEIRMLGSKDWDEYKVTKKMLRAYAPKNPMLATMIRDKRKFKHMLPMELFNKLQFHEMNNFDVSKSIEQSEVRAIALKAEPSKKNESKEKTSKSKKKEDSSDNDSTYEKTAMMVKNFKKFMKRRGDKKPVHQTRCYGAVRKVTTSPIVLTRKMTRRTISQKTSTMIKRRSIRTRARNTRRNMAMLMLVKVGSQVMTPTKKK
jgi:hypothetical protein